MPLATEYDRRDDSPSSIDTLKRAIALSPIRRKRDASRPPGGASPRRPLRHRFLLQEDYRGRLPLAVSRFIGYRPPASKPPYAPVSPLSWLKGVPLKYEVWATGWLGSFVGLLLVEAVMSAPTAFRDTYSAPLIIASFGATAVLVYGAIDSPLSQPRNIIGGHVISAIVGVAITRLFVLNDSYQGYLENREFHPTTFINGALCMATAILAQFVTGTLHPPGGATALIAAVEPAAVRLSWRYIPTILVSALLMFAWALIINNLGRRRYPQFWWSPESTFVIDSSTGPRPDEEIAIATSRENPMRAAEDGGRTRETLRQERMEGMGGNEGDLASALDRAGRFERYPSSRAAET